MHTETDSFGEDILDILSNFDFGFTFGGAFRIGSIFMEARYAIGLLDISRDKAVEERISGLQILGGISIPLAR
ncbi:MAG: hypothetical protein KDH95_09205 [Calditrichaeota bacterium]|nr:hypothetical protein [Calditrichota bacterium]MCB0268330.1 hypothetical protein [Calditrichota bacterium]